MDLELVLHDRFHDAYDAILNAIQHEAPDTIIAVVAPTGAGKSTLAKCVSTEVRRYFKKKGLLPGQIPDVYLEAEASEHHVFQWRPFYHQWLIHLEEPMLESKVDLAAALKAKQASEGQIRGVNILRDDLGYLRNRIREALEEHHTYLVGIDEANNIAAVGKSGSYAGQMHLLKTMANRMTCRIVMYGTAEMIPLLDQSAQLGRRVIEVSIEPYSKSDEDLKEFGSTAMSLFNRGPIPIAFTIAEQLLYLHGGTIGLIGVLAQWIRRAFARALRAGAKKLTTDHLKTTRLPDRKIRLLAREVAQCAAYFEGAPVNDLGRPAATTGSADETGQVAAPSTSRKKGKKLKPGNRRPHRDATGQTPNTRKQS
ncbi:MAG: AAA family ATPase [Gammaproteobacteria bacterium]|nr:AAA family ATPase [Gammaproteobacteria bacterium]